MKLSKTAWLVLGIGIFAIAAGCLYMLYSRELREQEQLSSVLSVAQATLPRLTSEKAELESQLAQSAEELAEAESLLDAAEAGFPQSVESIEFGEALVDIAESCDLEIVKLTASEPSDEEVKKEGENEASVTYPVTSYTVEVEGKYGGYIDKTIQDVLDFIDTIATDEYFANAAMEVVNMKVSEPGVTATIDFTIYSYQGGGE
jgi:ABC-type transporter Mla subunit MlaD